MEGEGDRDACVAGAAESSPAPLPSEPPRGALLTLQKHTLGLGALPSWERGGEVHGGGRVEKSKSSVMTIKCHDHL